MAEVITEDQPRIKFQTQRQGPLTLALESTTLADLAELMAKLEECGCTPILNDNLVAGNCAIAAAACSTAHDSPASQQPAMFVSRSGKQPGVTMSPNDFVLVTSFDVATWSAQYRSVHQDAQPTSDTPLHAAALLAPNVQEAYGWGEAPLVAVHGHALAEGEGLELAQRLGFPISHQATLFSTPEDLEQLAALFAAYPYPKHRCYVRRGHGFFVLGRSVDEVRRTVEQEILPHLGGPPAT